MEFGFGDALVVTVVVFTVWRWSRRRGKLAAKEWRWYLASIVAALVYAGARFYSLFG